MVPESSRRWVPELNLGLSTKSTPAGPPVIPKGLDKADQAIGQMREPSEGDLWIVKVVDGSLEVEETPGFGRTVPESDKERVEQATAREAAQRSSILNRALTAIGVEGYSVLQTGSEGKGKKLAGVTLDSPRCWWDSEPIVLDRSVIFAEGENTKQDDAMDSNRGASVWKVSKPMMCVTPVHILSLVTLSLETSSSLAWNWYSLEMK
jgi:hypothetical protein